MTLYDRQKAGTLLGAVVYRNYSPNPVGVIVKVLSPNNNIVWTGYSNRATVRVKWLKKTPVCTDEIILGLGDFESLVEEHERKAKKHRATLERVRGAA